MKMFNKFVKTTLIFFVAFFVFFIASCQTPTEQTDKLNTPNVSITNVEDGVYVFVSNDDEADQYKIRFYDETKEVILKTYSASKNEALIGYKVYLNPGTYYVNVVAIDVDDLFADSDYSEFIEIVIEKSEPVIKTYTIEYVLNGGTLPQNAKVSYKEGDNYVLPTPTKANCTFIGWYLNADFSGNKVTQTTKGDLVLYALFEENVGVETYTITYVLNGGTLAAGSPESYKAGDSVVLKNPTKSGATFLGWYDNANYTGSKITIIGNNVNKNITLYAKWNEVTTSYTGYYEDVNGLTGSKLKATLRTIISTGVKNTTYSNLKEYLPYTDADPKDSSKIMLFYSQVSVSNKWDPNNSWNREHVWPKSLGWYEESGAGADLHHLRPENNRVNSTRGNKPFGYVSGGTNLTYNGKVVGSYNSRFEPLDEVKGDVARIIMYMLVRYSETDSSYTYKNIVPSMELLLEWHELDPVSEFEIVRNQRTYEKQKNYNPFIDHPEFADMIWG